MKRLFVFVLCLLVVAAFAACDTLKTEVSESSVPVEESYAVTESSAEESFSQSIEESFDSNEESVDIIVSADDENITVSGDFGYVLAEDVAQLCAYYGDAAKLDVPEELDGHTVTAITQTAFANNASLTEINLGNSVINVAEGAFYGCTALEKVSIGNGVAVIYANSFDGCTSLTAIEVSHANGNYSSVDGVLYSKDKGNLIRCPQGFTAEEFVIPAGISLVGDGAFKKCSGIGSVVLPADCALSANSFFHCDNMHSFNFEGTVSQIPDYCFFGCVLLEEISIPSGTESLGKYAFFGCVGLKKLSIPSSVTAIDNTAFDCCTGIEEADVKGDCATQWYQNYQQQ